MTHRERVAAALARQPVDRMPVAFWRHVPEVDHEPRRLADAMLVFHERWGLDLIKVMSSGVYCVEDWGCRVAYRGAPTGARECTSHAVQTAADWARIAPRDPGAGALGRELEAVWQIARKRGDDAPILHTVFSPLTVARKLAGERLRADLREAPEKVRPALEAITVTLVRYVGATLEAGADGVFLAVQAAPPDEIAEAEHAEWEAPYLRRLLEALQARSVLILLHLHDADPLFDRLAAPPVHAVNWADRRRRPTLAEARERFAGALVGGLDEWGTLRQGPPAAIAAEVRDAVRQTDGVGLIVAPGCVLPLDVPDEHLEAVVEAAGSERPRGV